MTPENQSKLNSILPKLGPPEDYIERQGEPVFDFGKHFDAGSEISCVSDGHAALQQIEQEIARIDSRVDYLRKYENWDQERISRTCVAMKHRLRYKSLIQARLRLSSTVRKGRVGRGDFQEP